MDYDHNDKPDHPPIFPEREVKPSRDAHAKAPEPDWHLRLARLVRHTLDRVIAIERKMGATHSDLRDVHRLTFEADALADEIEPEDEPEPSRQTPDDFHLRQPDNPDMPYPDPPLGTGIRPGEPRDPKVPMPHTSEPAAI